MPLFANGRRIRHGLRKQKLVLPALSPIVGLLLWAA
jgi:hypothetical protein